MNRNDLQELARIRIEEAALLLANGKSEGAYYLSGYAIECALKACIARKTQQYDFPDKEAVNQSYTHDLSQLIKAAGLEVELDQKRAADGNFETNWAVVKDWSEKDRYRKQTAQKAQDLYSAITDATNGVLQWVMQHW
jgi:HEPN domain-containing protein